jgi:hypothetical protein
MKSFFIRHLLRLLPVCLLLLSNSQCSGEKGSSSGDGGKLLFDSGELASISEAQVRDDSGRHSHWKLESSGVLVQSADLGKLDESGMFPGSLAIIDDHSYNDFTVSFRLTLPVGSCGGLAFRRDKAGDFFRLLVVMTEERSVARLELFREGKDYVLDSAQLTAKPDRALEVKLTAKKEMLQVDFDGEEKLKTGSEALTSGAWGIFAGGAGGVRFERILVYEE